MSSNGLGPSGKLRSWQLELAEGVPPFPTDSIEFLGVTKGYPLYFNAAFHESGGVDPYVSEAFDALGIKGRYDLDGWTRSGASLSGMLNGIRRYDHPDFSCPRDVHWSSVLHYARRRFRTPGRSRASILEQVKVRRDTSAGWTFIDQHASKGDVYQQVVRLANRLSARVAKGRGVPGGPPAVGFYRTQLSREESPKVRLVWGYPAEIVLIEGRFAEILIDVYSAINGPIFIGRHMLKELPLFINELALKYRFIICTDWSGFDATIPYFVTKAAFDILRGQFELTEEESLSWDYVEKTFHRTTIVMPNGMVFRKRAGIPSGSYFTSLIGSVSNWLVTAYLVLRVTGVLPTSLKTLGDDSVFGMQTWTQAHTEELSSLASSVFGMQLNATKTVVATNVDEVEFLGHNVHAGRVFRDETKLLRLALYPERPVMSMSHSAKRVLGLMVDSGARSTNLLLTFRWMLKDVERVSGPPDAFEKHVIGSDFQGVIWEHDPFVWS